jgi:prepilin-type N-terminal cleavage/methylation domain-containing protein
MRRAFTLVELVLVLFLLALVAGLGLPAVGRGLETLELRAQAGAFAGFLRHAREQAITRREAQEVLVDPAAHRLTLTGAGDGEARLTRRLSERIAIRAESATGYRVTFSPKGVSSGGAFRLVAPDGRSYRISVHPLTGRVTSLRGEA